MARVPPITPEQRYAFALHLLDGAEEALYGDRWDECSALASVAAAHFSAVVAAVALRGPAAAPDEAATDG